MVGESETLRELKKIRELLEPKPTPPPPKGMWAEFVDFLSKYKVMGLAVAFILGLYLGTLVQALVADFIMPTIELIFPGVKWEEYMAGPFRVGHFIGALITFLIICLIIFLIVKLVKRWGVE